MGSCLHFFLFIYLFIIPPGEDFCPAGVPPSPDVSHPNSVCRHPTFSGCLTSGILSARHSTFSGCLTWQFNFFGQTCPDPLIALTRRASVADNSDSPDSLARQTLAIRRIHFRPQSSAPLDFNRHECFFFIIPE